LIKHINSKQAWQSEITGATGKKKKTTSTKMQKLKNRGTCLTNQRLLSPVTFQTLLSLIMKKVPSNGMVAKKIHGSMRFAT
jgi:hypothetical protein